MMKMLKVLLHVSQNTNTRRDDYGHIKNEISTNFNVFDSDIHVK
jgi:hypothetical protein